jgi:chaperonin GroES
LSEIESSRRLLRNTQAEYERAAFSGQNEAGVRPIGTSVLVLMDQCSSKSSGGVMMPEEILAKMNSASESGVVVAVGSAAFQYYDDGSKWTDYRPVPGDRVFTERYAGRELMGRDGNIYRMMTYTSIGGLEEPEAPAPNSKKPGAKRAPRKKG